MYEQFTDRARKAMTFAAQEAQRLKRGNVDSGCIFLGLLKEGSSVGANAIRNLGVNLHKFQMSVEEMLGAVPESPELDPLSGKRAVEYAVEEARALNHNFVGSEHLLLGLLREPEGVASKALMEIGLDPGELRDKLRSLLGVRRTSFASHVARSGGAGQPVGAAQPPEDGPGTHISTIPNNFMGLPGKLGDYASARYVVLPIPYDATTSYKVGTRNGPAAIIDASQQVEWFDEELLAEFTEAGIATLGSVATAVDSAAAQMQRIAAVAGPVVRDGKFLLSLGGEHSITSPLVELYKARHPGLCVLQIDAHADLRDLYQGSRYSHACVMRRVFEATGKLVQVGIRNLAGEEHQFIQAQGMKLFTPQVVAAEPDWIDQVLSRLDGPVYLTVDVDGFDPSVAPGTGTPEPGGLTWWQGLALLRRVCAEREVVGADIVEVMPLPGNHVTEFMAARLAYKLIAYTQRK